MPSVVEFDPTELAKVSDKSKEVVLDESEKYIEKYEDRAMLCIKEHDAEMKKAEKLYDASPSAQPVHESVSETLSQYTLFKPQSNLVPLHLEQGANHLEVSKFCGKYENIST